MTVELGAKPGDTSLRIICQCVAF